jgi:hypothetical protein
MLKSRKTGTGAGAWQDPSMKALGDFMVKLLEVPKVEFDKRLADERRGKSNG